MLNNLLIVDQFFVPGIPMVYYVGFYGRRKLYKAFNSRILLRVKSSVK